MRIIQIPEYTKRYKDHTWELTRLKVKCSKGSILTWCDIDDENTYNISISSHLSSEGEGWDFYKYAISKEIGNQSVDSIIKYVKANTPINLKKDDRIKLIYEMEPKQNVSLMILILCLIISFSFLLCTCINRVCCSDRAGSRNDYQTLNSRKFSL